MLHVSFSLRSGLRPVRESATELSSLNHNPSRPARNCLGRPFFTDSSPGESPIATTAQARQTVKNQLGGLERRSAAIKALGRREGDSLQAMSEQEVVNYFDRQKAFGAIAALQWAVNRHG